MPHERTAGARFMSLDMKRSTILSRVEHYSGLTLPYIFPPENHQEGNYELRNDHHSVGAQAVNHLANKIVLALFQPGFPFFKLDIPEKMRQSGVAQGLDTKAVDHSLAQGERAGLKEMAKSGLRPHLFEAIKQLIITGNCLPVFHSKDDFELVGLRNYVVRRSKTGSVLELVVRSPMTLGELDPEAAALRVRHGANPDPDTTVTHYYWIRRVTGGKYRVSQWVDDVLLPNKFSSTYPDYRRLPWQPQAWVLPLNHSYGVGLVEEYVGDLTSITEFAESVSDGAAMASVWRMLVDPSSGLDPLRVTQGHNGDVLEASTDAIKVFQVEVGRNIEIVDAVMQATIRRFSAGFLLMSSVTRDAERVTAAEIRTLAHELETGLGGVYSRLSHTFQDPLARYLLRRAGIKIEGTQIEPTVVTGFDALSRAAELERVQLFLGDVASITSLPPEVADWLKVGPILKALAANRHLDADEYIRVEEEVNQIRQQRREAEQAQTTEGAQ